VIVVLASEADGESARLTERWATHGALRLTPADLSRAGWEATFPGAGQLPAANGTVVAAKRIRGLLVRLGMVTAMDLPHLVAEDREYAAAEMTAFLSYWLEALECPVVNRPSPSFLLGPAHSQEQWLALGSRLGVPVIDVVAESGRDESFRESLDWVTVVGGQAFGGGEEARNWSLAVAREADVSLAGFGFADHPSARLAAVSCRPPVLQDDVCTALLALLQGDVAP